jgi:predicted small secreted protein
MLNKLETISHVTVGHYWLTMIVLTAWIALLAGCNTIHGLGTDIERGGEKIQDKSNR